MGWQRGEVLGEHYCLLRRLGGHGNRQTWLAFDLRSSKSVALKTLLFAADERLWQDQRLMEREAETLASISHPAIPKFYGRFEFAAPEGTYMCLVLEYISGESLAQLVERNGPIDAGRAKELAAETLDILKTLHALAPPVIHRDLKPDNLIVREGDGRVCLVDFGSVRVKSRAGRTLTVVGTYGYMAPEQFSGDVGPAADLYGLGATVLFAVSGRNPAEWPLRGLRLDLGALAVASAGLQTWLARMMEPNPTLRFADADQALEALIQSDLRGGVSAVSLFTGSRFCIVQSSDRCRVEVKCANPWSVVPHLGLPILSILLIGLGVYLAALDLNSVGLVDAGILIVWIGFLLFARGWPKILWEWRLVSDTEHRLLMRTLFGTILEHRTLPLSLQVAIGKGNLDGDYSVALVGSDGRRHTLGARYSQTEAEHLARFLREWLSETDDPFSSSE